MLHHRCNQAGKFGAIELSRSHHHQQFVVIIEACELDILKWVVSRNVNQLDALLRTE